MFPITVVDDFFPEPDKIVDFALKQRFFDTDKGRWPGRRTEEIGVLDLDLFNWISNKILSNYFETIFREFKMAMTFQIVTSFHADQYHPRNKGWIHQDKCLMGGIIFLTKDPEPDTGTSIFRSKTGYFSSPIDISLDVKEKLYKREEVSDDDYLKGYNVMRKNMVESIYVDNVYNRMMCFPATAYHGVRTYGLNKERLTLPFFLNGLAEAFPPGCRTP